MSPQKQKYRNRLDEFRRRMKLTTGYVAHLLGHKDGATFNEYERGDRLPSLINALRLGIILRVPIEFLFPELHGDLLKQIRDEEERLAQPTQATLF
jgi:DNA-binding XRE family transcriptional regulator